ncbi:hypothetical protein OS493_002717 [Desmophyllum pertusum]|uniref:NACHT domain-containing protein n=1 Tax=Desmophyllum pertusum TaxID=174260 RepID=A0A9W9YTN5_9CNID|nr:hypothetical protein OS493_002717 [Desmophyllum pertusum]
MQLINNFWLWCNNLCNSFARNSQLAKKLLPLFKMTLPLFKMSNNILRAKPRNISRGLMEMSAQQAEQARQEDENFKRMLEMFESLRVQHRPESPPERPFDLETFLKKLAARYRRTATVPTSVWSAKSKVDIRKVYTRLSMVKEDKSVPAEYADLFTKTERGVLPTRILVEGQAGIGKSTFAKKLSLDWVERDETNVVQERNVLKKFEVVLFIKLREVSHCQTLREVISSSDIFPEEDKTSDG